MKRRFSKILGVGLTLALLASLILTAAPVSAVTTPVVTLADGPTGNPAYEISKLNVYTVLFTTGAKVEFDEDIVVVFDDGIDISAITAADIKINTTKGLGGSADLVNEVPDEAVVDGQTLTITLETGTTHIIGAGAIVQLTIGDTSGNCVTNPDSAGAYNLTVATTQEAAVTSAAFTITVPDIPGLPGVASVYNPVGTLMARKNKLSEALDAAGEDYTIQVGRGTYSDTLDAITITHDGLTLVSTDGAADTIIDVAPIAIRIEADGVTVDGFTVESDVDVIQILGDDATVKNNIIASEPVHIGIFINAAGATVTGNELDEDCTMYLCAVSDCTISDNIFGEALNLYPGTLAVDGLTVTDNIMIGSAAQAIDFSDTGTFTDILIEGNTISGCIKDVAIQIRDATNITKLRILNNDIIDNTGDGIRIETGTWDATNVIKFNTITGNEDLGIDSAVAVDAALNWWGATGVSVEGDVTTAPILADTAEAIFSTTKAGTGAALDAKTTVGVKVEGADTDSTIAVAKYNDAPHEAKAGAIAYYEVYVVGKGAVETVTIKFYAGDNLTDVYLWSADTETWVAQDADFSVYGGFVSVKVAPEFLGGTPFVLVAGAAEALEAPKILSPDVGERDVDLRPSFAWTAIAGVLGYEFELADNPNFVAPLMKLSGELGRLIVPFYQYMPELGYSTPYYWRVRSVDATAESDWSGGVFLTVAEPEPEPEPEPRMWTCPQCGLTYSTRAKLEAHAGWAHKPVEPPDIIVEPDVEVIVPAETPITPGWIYVIIAVGAVLVIAMIVLIVRTRRVA